MKSDAIISGRTTGIHIGSSEGRLTSCKSNEKRVCAERFTSMMKFAKIVIFGEPKGKGRPKFKKMGPYSHPYTPEPTVMYENRIATLYQQTNQIRFADDDYVDIAIYAYYGIPQSKPKKTKAAMQDGLIRPIKKCDADNIVKIVCDSLNGVAYRDDVQVMDATIHRFYDEIPRVEVYLRSCDTPLYIKPQGATLPYEWR